MPHASMHNAPGWASSLFGNAHGHRLYYVRWRTVMGRHSLVSFAEPGKES